MSIMCDKDCKEGMPIPWCGWFVCLGLSPMCSSFGVISEAITIASRGDDCCHCTGKECSEQGENFGRNCESEQITQSELKELLTYNPLTGSFNWNKKRPGVNFLKDAGSLTNYGYLAIRVNKKRYLSHRLAWLYVHGSFPDGQIDHINHIRTDNRLENLRVVTASENKRNQKLSPKSISGHTGIYQHPITKRFLARIHINRKGIHLGSFKTIEEAIEARKKANEEHGFHTNHGVA